MTLPNANKLVPAIAAYMRKVQEEEVFRLLRGDRPVQSVHAKEISHEPARYTTLLIYTNPRIPAYKARVELSRKLDVSEEFRADTNEWLREFFGEEPYMIVTRMPSMGLPIRCCEDAIFCNPRVEGEIRRRHASGETFV